MLTVYNLLKTLPSKKFAFFICKMHLYKLMHVPKTLKYISHMKPSSMNLKY